MRGYFVYCFFIFGLISCSKGNPQFVTLKNSSSEVIYFLISETSYPTNPNEVAAIRPSALIYFRDDDRNVRSDESDQVLFRSRIDRGGVGIIMQSESGAIGGGTLGALNIAAMGPAIYSGSVGYNKPVFRSGGLLTLHLQAGQGIAIGRNLVVKESGDFFKDAPLRFHEYTHYLQQRKLGSANFYARVLKEYYQSGKGDGKWWNTYDTPGHLEHQSEILESFFRYNIFRFLKR